MKNLGASAPLEEALSLCCGVSSGEDIRWSVSQVLACRTFCNKMWQTLRFTLGVLAESSTPPRRLEEVAQMEIQPSTGHAVERVCVCVSDGSCQQHGPVGVFQALQHRAPV